MEGALILEQDAGQMITMGLEKWLAILPEACWIRTHLFVSMQL